MARARLVGRPTLLRGLSLSPMRVDVDASRLALVQALQTLKRPSVLLRLSFGNSSRRFVSPQALHGLYAVAWPSANAVAWLRANAVSVSTPV